MDFDVLQVSSHLPSSCTFLLRLDLSICSFHAVHFLHVLLVSVVRVFASESLQHDMLRMRFRTFGNGLGMSKGYKFGNFLRTAIE
jgi:hypothetical protein